MKLLFVSTAFPQPGDPARAPYNLRLCEALAEVHDVTVIAPVPWTRLGSGLPETPGVRVRYPTLIYPPGVLRSTHAWWLHRAVRRAARDLGASSPPDAIVSYWTWPDGAAAARLAHSYGVPIVMIVGGSDVLVFARLRSRAHRTARTLQQADAVVTVGAQLREAVAGLGVATDRIAVVSRGVNRQLFFPGSQACARQQLGLAPFGALLLWIGRLCAVKGPDLLLDALEPLAGGESRWQCAIVGEGPMRRALERRVAGGPLRGRVSFVGTIAPALLADWYRAADALIVSSRSEGVPNVIYEARACGTPVVAMNAGDVAQAIGGNDTLVPAGDVDALTAAIGRAIAHPGAARVAAALTSWQESAAALVRVIERVRGAQGFSARTATVPPSSDIARRA